MISQARRAARIVIAVGAIGLAFACGSPMGPDPPPPPPPPPANAAPVIRSVTVDATRTEVDRDIAVVAVVEDAETNPAALTYAWTTTAGTIQGTGREVTWRLAKGAAQTPANVTVTLVVTEPYQVLENNVVVTRQHRVERTSESFRVHDSVAEITQMTLRFLIDLFGNSNISPDACVVDFSDTCPGKATEHSDIVKNRAERRITSVQATVQSVSFNGAMTSADVRAACTFRDIDLATGQPLATSGRCELSVVYHSNRWWLCSSNYPEYVVLPNGLAAPRRTISSYWRSGGDK